VIFGLYIVFFKSMGDIGHFCQLLADRHGTIRYFGVEVDDALEMSDQTEI
jgi:hypothetical protein